MQPFRLAHEPATNLSIPFWIALALVPIFQEINFLGVELKGQIAQEFKELAVTEDVQYLFATRYNLERELLRIRDSRVGPQAIRMPVPISKLIQMLVEAELIDPRLGNIVKEVYAVCSPAIHGERVSDSQIKFVKDIAPELISTLRSIS